MHHSRSAAGEPAEPREIEVERVEEARRRTTRDAVGLDVEAAALELMGQRAEELVPASAGGRRELVEERQVGPVVARAEQVDLGPRTSGELSPGPAHGPRNGARLHDPTR
jgi:hypothetical protein